MGKRIPHYLFLTLIMLAGCSHSLNSKSVENVLASSASETGTARVRLYPKIREKGYSDYLGVEIIKDGKKQFVGFNKPIFSWSSIKNIDIGMPKTPEHASYVKKKKPFGEYSVPANLPLILGYRSSKSCEEGGVLSSKCWSHYSQRWFTPEAGKNYEIWSSYHVYEITADKVGKKIILNSEILNTRKL